jgi:adenosylmethionine---8-amino-7-oxononanoate aminotransferase
MMQYPLWYPYAQMKTLHTPLEVVNAAGAYLTLADGRELLDGISSWWCVIHGYNHPELNEAATAQMERFTHVMLGGLTHQPVRLLAEKLVEITPEGLNHVFFADSGSVGMEVALKMSLQYWQHRGAPRKQRFVSLKRAYHGDTLGAMAVSDQEEGMHATFSSVLPAQIMVDAPEGFDAESEKIRRPVAMLREALASRHDEIAAVVLEPLMQGAGGLYFYHPEYLREARALCDAYGVLLVFDEVATGFGRTGALFAAEKAQVCPDIMVLSKALTAGYFGLSATIATSEVFHAFWSDDPSRAFMHGPTFMGHATACAVALKSIEIFMKDRYLERISMIESVLREELEGFRAPGVRETRVYGAAGVIEVEDVSVLRGASHRAAAQGVWLRPFGRFLYTMPSYCVSEAEVRLIARTMKGIVSNG